MTVVFGWLVHQDESINATITVGQDEDNISLVGQDKDGIQVSGIGYEYVNVTTQITTAHLTVDQKQDAKNRIKKKPSKRSEK